MKTELLILIVTHFACSDIADERTMTPPEMAYCSAIYQEMKLGFVPGVSPSNYAGLSPKEKAAVNQAGFLAYRAWIDENPLMVGHLERVARGEEQLSRAG